MFNVMKHEQVWVNTFLLLHRPTGSRFALKRRGECGSLVDSLRQAMMKDQAIHQQIVSLSDLLIALHASCCVDDVIAKR